MLVERSSSSSDDSRFLSSSSSHGVGVRIDPAVVGVEGSYGGIERTADAVDDGRGFETDVMRMIRLLLVMLLLLLLLLEGMRMILMLMWLMLLRGVGIVELRRDGCMWVRRRRW